MSNGLHLTKGSSKPQFPDDGVLCLYSMRFCPYAQRIHLVLDAKKVQYRTVYINLSEKPEWLTDVSPLGKVPALDLRKNTPPLIESLIIADYLDEVYPQNPLHSKDPLQKANDRILIDRFAAVTSPIYKILLSDASESADAFAQFAKALEIYENELRERGTRYFSGDKPGMLDYMIWPWIERSAMLKYLTPEKYDLDKTRFKQLLAWCDSMISDPAVQASYISGENHAKFIETRRTPKPDYNMLA